MSATITSLSLKDVRCFPGIQRVDLAKITLLVGENSAGKTTFLGCLNSLGYLAGLEELSDRINSFDQASFSMGSFKNIVRSGCLSFRVGIGLRSDYFQRFEIEFEESPVGDSREMVLELQLTGSSARNANDLKIARQAGMGDVERWSFDGSTFHFELEQSEVSYSQFTTWLSRLVRQGTLPFNGEPMQYRKRKAHVTDGELAAFSKFINFFRHQFRAPEAPVSLRPINPAGLERKRFYKSDPLGIVDGTRNVDAINNVGNSLGLYRRIDVRELSSHQFEVLVDVSGTPRNLADVGYGVTSLLPFISDLVDAPQGSLFLLQQPEIHIHPSAQAKLVQLMAKSNHMYVVETHSDHVVDWFRILVTEGKLEPTDVSIIYFERLAADESISRLYQLSLDGRGNFTGQPRNYRQFFSEETTRLLGLPV